MDEFNRIYTYFEPLTSKGAYGLMDDTADLPISDTHYIISTDTIISGVHFIGNETSSQIAQKLLAVNLSDLASVGATPLYYTLNLSLPKGLEDDWVQGFVEGLSYMQRLYGVSLVGGDTTHFSSTENIFVLSATVYGNNGYNTHRTNAKVGDYVCITAPTGLGYVGLQIALGKVSKGTDMDKRVIQYYQTPTPHTDIAYKLMPYVSACCDVSDGLIADIEHIARASHVDITLYMQDIPVSDSISMYCDVLDIPHAILSGGDDYVLACTISPENIDNAKKAYPNLYTIGRVGDCNTSPAVYVMDTDNKDITPTKKGFIHR